MASDGESRGWRSEKGEPRSGNDGIDNWIDR